MRLIRMYDRLLIESQFNLKQKKHQNKLKSAENEPSMAFSFGGRGFNPPWGHMVSSKDTSMSLSDCVKLATSKFELEPSSSTF